MLSGTELIPLFPYLRAGLGGGGGGGKAPGNRLLATTMALQGFLTIRSTQAWAYRSPDKVSLDRRLKFAITCEFPQVPSNLPTDQAVVIQQLSIG